MGQTIHIQLYSMGLDASSDPGDGSDYQNLLYLTDLEQSSDPNDY